MPPIMHTLFYFVVALAVLITVHEYGHFIVARNLGVKVLRFSLGFGKSLWRYQKSPASTEFTISMLPLGGYVKMVDEREGEVSASDLPFAFNRQPVWKRSAIVLAGPVFNLVLAILIYWGVFMAGETGTKPILGTIPEGSLAAQSGFKSGDEILTIAGRPTLTWSMAMGEFLEHVVDTGHVSVRVRTSAGDEVERAITVPKEIAEKPNLLHDQLGFEPWRPELPAIIDRVEPRSAAASAGLASGDLLKSVEGEPIKDWQQWVAYVRAHAGQTLRLTILRSGVESTLNITPTEEASATGKTGRIGAAVKIPAGLLESMQVEYKLGLVPALAAAITKTYDYSAMTLRMMGKMLIGQASVENLSGPISIAQYAGQSARMGYTQFLKFLAIVSISLGVLNLLPIPVLDGGHLMFYLVEGITGSPVSEKAQAICQQFGLFVLLSLMALAFFLDIERLFA